MRHDDDAQREHRRHGRAASALAGPLDNIALGEVGLVRPIESQTPGHGLVHFVGRILEGLNTLADGDEQLGL